MIVVKITLTFLLFPCNSENKGGRAIFNERMWEKNKIQMISSTLRNAISWDFISCSTNLMMLERETISLFISSILWLIVRFFCSSSAFKAESLAASCSFRKWRRASNSSLICVSLCSAWFWKDIGLIGNHCLRTRLCYAIIRYWWDWRYLNMFCHFLTNHFCLLVEL